MYHWQSSLSATAAGSPVQLETTRKILQLMSLGQFVPPPLDGVAEIIDILHPFHLHCILVDIWNYVRDNVPSPGDFNFFIEKGVVIFGCLGRAWFYRTNYYKLNTV